MRFRLLVHYLYPCSYQVGQWSTSAVNVFVFIFHINVTVCMYKDEDGSADKFCKLQVSVSVALHGQIAASWPVSEHGVGEFTIVCWMYSLEHLPCMTPMSPSPCLFNLAITTEFPPWLTVTNILVEFPAHRLVSDGNEIFVVPPEMVVQYCERLSL